MPVLPKFQLKALWESGDLITQTTSWNLIEACYNPDLVAGVGITLSEVTTPSGTTITINSTAGGGGVTSFTATDGPFISFTPNTTQTGVATLTGTLSATGVPDATTFLRGDNTWTNVASSLTFTNLTPTPQNFPGNGAFDNIPTGTNFTAQTFTQMMNAMLYPVLNPSLSNPSSAFNLIQSGYHEAAESIPTLNFSATFNRGSISPAYGTSGFRSGLPNTYNYGGTGLPATVLSTSLSNAQSFGPYIVLLGTQSWTNTVSYDIGEQPLDNVGNPYSTPLPAGTTATQTEFIYGVYPPFATTVAIGTLTKQTLQSMTSTIQVTVVAESFGSPLNRQTIDVPTAWSPITSAQFFNTFSSTWDPLLLTTFTISATTHVIQGNVINYTRYTNNVGFPRGALQIRMIP
jgi:hypothetical protein